jgi:threonine dehydrogenase-like Zn-dependent dehydrogenase
LWDEDAKKIVEQIREMTNVKGADLCVDTVGFEPERSLVDRAKDVINFEKGSVKVLEACMSGVLRGGIVSFLSVYPTKYDNFPIRA